MLLDMHGTSKRGLEITYTVTTEVQTYLIVEISYLATSRTSSPELGESAQLTTQG